MAILEERDVRNVSVSLSLQTIEAECSYLKYSG